MKKTFISFAALTGVVLMFVTPSVVHGICPVSGQPLTHSRTFFDNCTEPIAFALVQSLPIPGPLNEADSNGLCTGAFTKTCTAGKGCDSTGCSGVSCVTDEDCAFDIVCEAGPPAKTPEQDRACQPEAGTGSDGNVTVDFDWAGFGGVQGCPNQVQAAGAGRNILQVIDADGKEINLAVGYDLTALRYTVDSVHPAGKCSTTSAKGCYSDDDCPGAETCLPLAGTDDPRPISCARDSGPSLINAAPGPGASQTTLELEMANFPKRSDCNPGSIGEALGTCAETVERGAVWTRQAPCATRPGQALNLVRNCTAGQIGNCTGFTGSKTCADFGPRNGDPCVVDEDCGPPCPSGVDTDCDSGPPLDGTCANAEITDVCTGAPGCVCFFCEPGGCTDGVTPCTLGGGECIFFVGDGVCTGTGDWDVAQDGATIPDPPATFNIVVDNPAAPDCLYVGQTFKFTGSSTVETDVLGMFRVQSALAAADTARIKSARLTKGKVRVGFETAAELGDLLGFEVLADGNPLNKELIAPLGFGGGGHDYTFVGKKGKLRGGETIVVRSFLTGSGTIDSDPEQLVADKGKGKKPKKPKKPKKSKK